MSTRILVCTNGFEGSWAAIEYGAWAAGAIEAELTLLGILEDGSDVDSAGRSQLDDIIQRAAALFQAKSVSYVVEHESGRADEIVPRAAARDDFLTTLGPLGRPRLKRLLLGRSIRSLLAAIPTPVLYVPRACLPVKKILICLGGLGYEITAEDMAVRLSLSAGAEATLLHVAPPVDLDYPTARAEKEHWRDLATTDTLTGRNLRRALDQARAAGLRTGITMRQGSVVDEILAEIKAGSYDLICMGSGHGAHGLRHVYEPNVTDEIAEHAECPLLTARYSAPAAPSDDRSKED